MNRLLLYVLIAGLPVAFAQEKRELGRLFYTPEQRRLIEAAHRERTAEKSGVSGRIQRRGGTAMEWKDGAWVDISLPLHQRERASR